MAEKFMSQKLNILHILRAPIGGLFRHVRDLAVEQTARGHNVGLLVDANTADALTNQRLNELREILTLGVSQTPMARSPSFSDVHVIRETNRLVTKLDIDVLHGHGAKGGLYARLAGIQPFASATSRKPPKRFYTPHGGTLHFTDNLITGLIYMGMETVLDRFSDGLIFESRFARQAFEEGLGQPKSQTRVIANGLQPSDFDAVSVDSSAAQFLYIGELRQLKGVDVLLRAFKGIDQDPAPRLVIVGDGPDAQSFKDLAHDLNINDRVEFAGMVPAGEAFSKGQILVVPSRAESLPYVVLEGAAAGLPIIATRVGGVPEIMWGTDTKLVAPDDVEALQTAMNNAICNIDNTQARAARLRDSIMGRFTVSTMTSSILAFYQDALRINAPSQS